METIEGELAVCFVVTGADVTCICVAPHAAQPNYGCFPSIFGWKEQKRGKKKPVQTHFKHRII